jgi:hypothetical protein
MDYKQLSAGLTKYRGNWEIFWQEVAERCFTDQADFNVKNTKGVDRNQRVYDATATMAVNRSASAITGLITPKSERWHTLSTDDDELNKSQAVKRYFDEVTRILFAHRYSAKAGFETANYQAIRSLMGFGTGQIAVNENAKGDGIVYQALFLGDMFYGVSNYGIIDTAMRDFTFTKRQAIQQWGFDALPRKIQEDKNNDTEYKFCHIVHANDNYDEFSVRADKRQFSFAYLYKEEMEKPLEVGGYFTFPFAVCREMTSPNEIYGRSPAMQMLPEIKGLNLMRKDNLIASQLSVRPPLLAPSDGIGVGILGAGPLAINFKPGAVTKGGVNAQGQQMIHPMNTGSRPDLGQQAIEESRRTINDSFYLNLFQILVETPTMTATEVLARTQEKGILLAPTAARLEQEYLGPMIERELDILSRQNKLPELPGELVEAGGEYTIKYESPLTRAQRSSQLIGIQETVNMAMTAASVDPSVLDRIDMDKALMQVAEINNTPASIVRSDAETQELRASRQQAEQQQNVIEQAPAMAGAARDIAEAQNVGM